MFQKCKIMERAAKAERPIQWPVSSNIKDYVPPRETADKLVHLYLRVFESTYRILHVPSFQRDYAGYWNDPENVNAGFIVKMLLVMAIGSMFYQEPDFSSIRLAAQQWVYVALSWMSAPFEKGRLNFCGLQVHCLVILARQSTAVGADLVWIDIGSLIRMAITMGFHRDPKLFPRMSVLHAELRRRLWATVLEMAVQCSFNSGNPPLISPGDWDTEPPSNIDDCEVDETTKTPPASKPSSIYTQTSISLQLLKSLSTRLEIARLVNNFRSELCYDDVIRLGTEIMAFAREGVLLAQNSPVQPTTIQRNLLDSPLRQVLLTLHFPYAMKARTDPRFYFSRKVCLDTAITVFTYPSTSAPPATPSCAPPVPLAQQTTHDDYTRLKLTGRGYIKEVLTYPSISILLELLTQLEEESPQTQTAAAKAAREPLRRYVTYMIELTGERIRLGDNNIKPHIFVSAMLAQVDALERGEDPDQCIAKATKDSTEMCYRWLKQRVGKPPSSIVAEHNYQEDMDRNEQMYFGTADTMDREFTFEYLMPDTNFGLEIPDSCLFDGWEESREW